MAANDYYNSFKTEPSHGQCAPYDGYHHPASNNPPPLSPYDSHSDPYRHRQSQNSFTSDHHYDPVGGGNHGPDQYAEDIPLKPNAQQPPQVPEPDWMRQNTQYHPAEVPLSPDTDARGRRRRGFFKKKIAWVTYLLTLIDVAVFVGELIKNGT